jgi:hypothetical protein
LRKSQMPTISRYFTKLVFGVAPAAAAVVAP